MRHKKILLSLFAVLSFVSNAVFAQVVATDALLGSVLQSFAPAGRQPSALALDERNNIVYVAAPKQVTAIDAITGMVKKVYPGLCDDSNNMRIVNLEVKQTSLMVVCRDYGLTFLLVNLITEKVDETVSGFNVAISPNDNIYARTNNNNRVEMFSESSRVSVSSYKDVGGYEDKSAEQKMVFSPDSSILAVVGSRGTLSLIDVSIGNDIATIGTDTETLRTVRFTADGQSLIVLSDQRLRVLRLGSLAVQFEQPLTDLEGSTLIAFQLGADNNTLLLSTERTVSGGGKTRTLLFDLSSSATPAREFSQKIIGISADGRYVVTLEDGTFTVRGSLTQNLFLKSRVDVLIGVATPNAQVSINGNPLNPAGDGSYAGALYPGNYDLLIQAPGFRPYTRSLRVASGTPVSVNVALEAMRGSLRFESVPSGASVTVNGVVRGVTPLSLSDLPLGLLEYSLRLSDYREVSGRVTITDETPVSVRPSLEELPGLRITSVPSGASIAIDGRTVGVTPLVASNLTPGRVTFTATLAGYAAFSGRAIVPNQGKGSVEIVLNRATTLNLPAQPEAASLRFNPSAVETSSRALVSVNGVPMLPVSTLARLTGLGVYGDATVVTLASASSEVRLIVGEPTRTHPTAYVLNGTLYAPLIGLEPLGIRVIPAASVVLGLNDDRLDLGAVSQRVFTESVVAPVRAPWRTALERAIVLDGAPAFAVRDLLGMIRGLGYAPETLTLTLNSKPLLRAFVAPKGFTASLVVFRGSAYLPSALLPALGVGVRLSAGSLELRTKDVEFALRFATPGRPVTNTRAIIAERDAAKRQAATQRAAAERRAEQELARAHSRITATRNALEVATGLNLLYLGSNRWGNVQTRYEGGAPYSVVTMYVASSAAPAGWQRCTWTTGLNVVHRDLGGGDGLFYVLFDTLGGQTLGTFAFRSALCQLVSVN